MKVIPKDIFDRNKFLSVLETNIYIATHKIPSAYWWYEISMIMNEQIYEKPIL